MKNIIKKTLAVLILIMFTVILNSCGGESTTSTTAGLKLYEGGEFSINIDPSWKIINKSDFYAEIPQETIVAFTTPESYDGFFINVNIVKENLQEGIEAIDYARANINLSAQNLTDYEKVQEAKIDLGGMPTMVHIFQARLNPTEKLIRFVQLYAVRGTSGYIITGGMLPSTPKELRDTVGAVVTSFKLR